jgi:hypothetical protein
MGVGIEVRCGEKVLRGGGTVGPGDGCHIL